MLPLEVTSRLVTQVSLAEYTNHSLIIPRLRATDTPGVIAELSHVLQQNGCVPDVLPLYHAALNKELTQSTAQECGIAFPHARLSAIKSLTFAIGCASRPIVWGGNGSPRIQIVFLIAVPATDAANCLHLLASMARLGQRPDIIERMLETRTASNILSLLSTIPVRH